MRDTRAAARGRGRSVGAYLRQEEEEEAVSASSLVGWGLEEGASGGERRDWWGERSGQWVSRVPLWGT